MPDDDDVARIHEHLDAKIAETFGKFYDRAGNEIPWTQFAERKLMPPREDVIGLDTVDGTEVSTVWLGWAEGKDWTTGLPLIFETLVSGPEGSRVWARYTTEAEAEDGHRQVLATLRNRSTD